MRTSTVIDDELLKAAQQATGLNTTKAVVEAGLKLLARLDRQKEASEALRGAADWEGDLRAMRADRKLPNWDDDVQTQSITPTHLLRPAW